MQIVKFALVALAGYVAARAIARSARDHGTSDGAKVRQAGPREMKDPPDNWDMVDERADESFPASDPPGTY